MILYHGSCQEIAEPDLTHSRKNVDFGHGFYTTPIRMQAVKWCEKFKRQGKGRHFVRKLSPFALCNIFNLKGHKIVARGHGDDCLYYSL